MISRRAIPNLAALPFLLLIFACGGGQREAFRREIPVRQLLPAPADTTWRDQPAVRTPLRVGADSLPVVVEWTPAHRGAHRGISRVVVLFPRHPASDSLEASLLGGAVKHGTRDAIVEGLMVRVQWTRPGQLSNTLLYLTGDGRAQRK